MEEVPKARLQMRKNRPTGGNRRLSKKTSTRADSTKGKEGEVVMILGYSILWSNPNDNSTRGTYLKKSDCSRKGYLATLMNAISVFPTRKEAELAVQRQRRECKKYGRGTDKFTIMRVYLRSQADVL